MDQCMKNTKTKEAPFPSSKNPQQKKYFKNLKLNPKCGDQRISLMLDFMQHKGS